MTKLDEFKEKVKGKNITVIGIGISNLPLIKYLSALGANVTACDKRSAEELGKNYDELKDLNITFKLGENYLENINADIIFKTPGMRYDNPYLVEAREKGVEITSEMEVFFDVCPTHIIAVTGSDGKTTTTTLISEMLKSFGYKVWLGGNIGNPLLCDVEKMEKTDISVLELSSFQLHTMRKSPNIAVITNISPNHLDVHKDYEEYIEAKKNIMLYQSAGDILVVNADNAVTNEIGDEAKGYLRKFSRSSAGNIYISDDGICCGNDRVLNIHDIKIPGMHNVENYMAAIAAVYDMVDDEAIVSVARNFGGVEHRIELVRVKDGVKYYNSSIDSSPNRTINTLKVFPEKVIMIAGGKDKGIPYDDIGPAIVEHVKTLILIGATSDKIREALEKTDGAENVRVIQKTEYGDAVKTAHDMAEKGDTVLLSPASTSFDMFRNFEERGNLFKRLVNEL